MDSKRKLKRQKGAISVLLIIGLVVVLVAIVYGLKVVQKTDNGLPGEAGQEREIPEGWRLYSNLDYGFSLAYPPGTEVTRHMLGRQGSMDGFLIYGDDFEESVWVYSDDCDQSCFEEELVNWWPKTKLDSQEKQINGHPAVEINFDDQGKVRREIYIRGENNVVIYFVFEGLSSVDQELSSQKQGLVESVDF